MSLIIRYLKLPFRFPAAALQAEVDALTAAWSDHYNTRDYEGIWTALPLRSVNGDTGNVLADCHNGAFRDTELMKQCPRLAAVVNTLQCEKNAVRLLNLHAGGVIKEHRDAELNFETGEARIHVPIYTNDQLEFYLDNERVVMNEGECWYMNFNRKHRVVNNGTTNRIHLVIDCIVNDWLTELFTAGNWEIKNIIAETERYSSTEKQQIIDQLLRLNTPQSLQMAKQMEQELAAI